MTDFEEYLATATTSYTEPTAGGDGLLRVHWFNGDQKLRTRGAFFVTTQRLADHGITPTEPWRAVTRTFSSGDTEDGYEAPMARLAVLHVRKSDIVYRSDGSIEYISRPARGAGNPPGWSLHIEILCVMQGLGTEMPVVWSSKRVKTSLAMVEILTTYRREILEPLRREQRKQMPPWWFWLSVAGEVNEQRQPVYVKTKGAPVTPPQLLLPNGLRDRSLPVRDAAHKMWVGRETASAGERLFEEYRAWAAEPLRSLTEAQPAAPSHNAPQPIGDDFDTPF